MKLLSHIRSKSKLKNDNPEANVYDFRSRASAARYGGKGQSLQVSSNVLKRIFGHVCPHVHDDTYVKLEDSMQDGDCMLCDLRDLAHCALVNRQWTEVGRQLL